MAKIDLRSLVVNGVVTHGGVYHADDVVSAILLKAVGIINSYSEIQRVSQVPEGFKGLAFDIGGGEFDHHQENCRLHHDNTKYAACTLIGENILPHCVYGDFYRRFLRGIELTDNTGQLKAPNYYSKVVSSAFQLKKTFVEVCEGMEGIVYPYLLLDNDPIEVIKNPFTEGIMREFNKFEALENKKVEEFIQHHKGEKVALLEEHLPAFKFAGSSLVLLIEKSLRGGFNITVVANKMKIPAEVKSWEGCTFVHPAGFIAAFVDLESAQKAAEKLLK